MAFPTTAVIDDFNRADGAIGANYTIPTFAGGMNVASNVAVTAVANGLAIRNTATYQNCEVYATLVTKPADGSTASLFFRAVQVASAVTIDGYALVLSMVAGAGNDILQFVRIDNGVGTVLATIATQEITAGQTFGVNMIGTTMSLFVDGTFLGSTTDATYTAAGNIGLALSATSGSWDNFGGGNLLPPAIKPAYYPAMAGIITR